MNLITWSESFSTGMAELDNDHKEVIDEVNLLWKDCINQYKAHKRVEAFLNKISQQINEHIQKEETILEQQKIERRERAKAVFRDVLEDLDCLEMDYSAGFNDYDPEIELKKILHNWLIRFARETTPPAEKTDQPLR